MRMINHNTKLIALLGTPLSQSLSPVIQNAAYEAMGIDYLYYLADIAAEGLEPVVKAFRYMNYAGFAITKPYKVDVIKYLDEFDDSAKLTGSCNTVVIRDGRYVGYNTDGTGCIRSLREQGGIDIAGKTFFCYGAGGTGMSVCPELARHGAKRVYIVDVNDSCASLAVRINARYPGSCEAIHADEGERIKAIQPTADVVMNLSGLGMHPHEDRTPADKTLFRAGQLCYDAIYNDPVKSRFLLDAEEMGCRTLNGLGMLLYQAAEQIRLWTGLEAAVGVMGESLYRNQ